MSQPPTFAMTLRAGHRNHIRCPDCGETLAPAAASVLHGMIICQTCHAKHDWFCHSMGRIMDRLGSHWTTSAGGLIVWCPPVWPNYHGPASVMDALHYHDRTGGDRHPIFSEEP